MKIHVIEHMLYFDVGYGVSPFLGAVMAIVEDSDQKTTRVYPFGNKIETYLLNLKLTRKHHIGIGLYFEIQLTLEEAKKYLAQILNDDVEYV